MADYVLADLLTLMERLRDPADGCPWDLKQSFNSITKYTLEEVYEVIDAIERNDPSQLRDELGDLLFQIVFYAQLGAEKGEFNFNDVVNAVTTKLLRRHPHVFPDGTLASRRQVSELSDDAIRQQWEQLKSAERVDKGQHQLLADIPAALPALLRAEKLQKRVAMIGMDFPNITAVLSGIKGEIAELEAAIAEQDGKAISDELGDVLFSVVNLSRHFKLDAEQCLRAANAKFTARVQAMDQLITRRQSVWEDFNPTDLDLLWQAAKDQTK